jgi:hypothetical protein
MQPADSSVQQGPDDRLSRGIPGQLIQISLNDGSGVFIAHRASHRPEDGYIES